MAEQHPRDGVIGLRVHPLRRRAVMAGLRCEADFVARREPFRGLADQLVFRVAHTDPPAGTIPEPVRRDVRVDPERGSVGDVPAPAASWEGFGERVAISRLAPRAIP